MKFLVFATDVLPIENLPTSGTALRTFGLVQGLRAHGHTVEVSVPRTGLNGLLKSFDLQSLPSSTQKAVKDYQLQAFDSLNQIDIINQLQPDCIICGHWPAMILQIKPSQTLIIDLAGPHLLERHYQRSPHQDAAVLGKLTILGTADGFIVSGPSQQSYFSAFMMRAGVRDFASRVATITMPLSPEIPVPRRQTTADYPRFIFGGVFLPWQDPSLPLQILSDELTKRNAGSLTLIGGPHPNYPVKEGKYAELFEELSKNPRVTVKPMMPLAKFTAELQSADVAMDLMAWNLERELALTIRSTTYLWSGLPVIYNNFADLGRMITDYNAGWCADPTDESKLRQIIGEIFSEPQDVLRKSNNATRLAAEVFSWDRAVLPLLEMLHRIAELPSEQVDIIVDFPENADFSIQSGTSVTQYFLCRNSGLNRVDLRIATHERRELKPVRFRVSRVSHTGSNWANLAYDQTRTKIFELELSRDYLNNNEWICLPFPRQDNSRGQVYALEIESDATSLDESISPWAIRATPFPLLSFFYGSQRMERIGLCLRTICSPIEHSLGSIVAPEDRQLQIAG